MSASELKNSHHRRDESPPFIRISTTPPSPNTAAAAYNNILNRSNSSNNNNNNQNSNNASGNIGGEFDVNHLHSPEDLQPKRIPQEHHFRIDSKTRNLHHQSRVFSPLIPPVFREVSSWSSFIIQAMFGLVSAWLIVDWILFPSSMRGYENSKESNLEHTTEEEETKLLLRKSFEWVIIFHVLIESLLNCLMLTLLRFTLAEHTFRNLKSNIVNTNQFLSFQYPRTIIQIFLRPFWIFYCLLAMPVESGSLLRMIVFLIASIVGFYDVQQFSRSVLYLQYKSDEISKFIYVDVEYKENCKESPLKSTLILTTLLPLLLIVQVLSLLSIKNIIIFGFSCVAFVGVDNSKSWPEAIRYNIRYLAYGISQIGLIWAIHQL